MAEEDKEKILGRHLEAKTLVEKCLEEDIRCRNDDFWLCLQVWKKQGIKIFVDFTQLKIMFNPETIIRNRAFIQNDENRLLPTIPQVLVKRKVKEEVLRNYYADNPALLQEWENIKFDVR
jgi:hypothetical protein